MYVDFISCISYMKYSLYIQCMSVLHIIWNWKFFCQIINYSSINKFLIFYSRIIIGFFFLAVIWIDSAEMSRKWFFFQFVALVWNHILSLVNLFYSLLYNTIKINIIWAAKLIKLKYSCLLYYNLLLVYFRHHHYKLNFVYYKYIYI